ncbi:malonic semialdehyde reductase, partial [Halomonas cerina]|nr:hypothetical protein [Halomonas cerina]
MASRRGWPRIVLGSRSSRFQPADWNREEDQRVVESFLTKSETIDRGEYYGPIYQSPVDDTEAALQTAIDVLEEEPKERLKPALLPGNQEKTMKAPVVAVLSYDTEFYEHLPRMFSHNKDAKSLFEGKTDFINSTAFRNSSIQGGYFILAARAVGLSAGPMSGFNNAAVDEEFFPDG